MENSNWRVIVVAVIQNSKDEYLICRKPTNRGVFPGQWALPGGGIEPGEHMEDALRREIKEEVGIEVFDIHRLFFKDGQYPKLFPDGSSKNIYMIFLIFACCTGSEQVAIGEEFETYAWVKTADLSNFDLNQESRDTFIKIGLLPQVEEVRREPSPQHLRQAVETYWETLPPFWQRIRAHIRQVAAEEFDLSFEQFQILRYIRQGRCTVSELAEAKNISRPATSQAVAILVDRGLVTRRTDELDRRHIRLALTASGDILLDVIMNNTRQWMMEILSPLSDGELISLTQAMNTLRLT
jgi:nucleoside triphosphatase